MESPRSAEVVILGGGPSGLCVAWNLVQDGYKVVLLEKEPVCGGQSITFQRGEYRYDLGPHNIHTVRSNIRRFLQQSLGDEFLQHSFHSEIYFQGKSIKYPFEGMDILRSVSPLTSLGCFLGFLWSRGRSLFIASYKDDGSYKKWVINRFGYRFYSLFFGPYSEKVWGIPPAELSDVVAKKRISVQNIIQLVHSVLFKKEQFHPENARMIKSYYPRKGVGAISDFFREGILKHGGVIVNNATVESVECKNGRITNVMYSHPTGAKYIAIDSKRDNRQGVVVSTIPVNELVLSIAGEVPGEVRQAAKHLDFTAERFLYLNMRKKDIYSLPLFYFSEPEFPFNRIYDVGVFSRAMVPEGKTALCLEISCTKGDDTWGMDDKTLFERCLAPLERHGLLQRNDVEDYHTRRLAHAYPRFRVGFKERLGLILDYLEHGFDNFYTLGRQGLFAYVNVDDAIWMGFELAKHISYRERLPMSISELLPEYINI